MLEIKDLHVSYGKIRAIHGINMTVQDGEVVTLIGANGAGKSTILKALSGLLRPERGSILFNGVPIHHVAAHLITQSGLVQVPEGRRIFPLLSVDENLNMGGFFRRDIKNRQADLERIHEFFPVLRDRRHQLGGTLSGGEQQMLAIGRALMSRPSLLMLDEPSMGLAPVLVEKIFSIIKDINKAGVTILLVEQNARAALSLASRGYVLETGAIVMEDDSPHLLNNEKVKQCYLGIEEHLMT